MAKFTSHDDYIEAAPERFRPLLRHLRKELAKALPDMEEIIRHDMPGFGVGKTVVAGYAAFSKSCGLYVSKGAIAAHAGDIAAAGLKASKTGITFSPRQPVPDALVVMLALASREDAEEQAVGRSAGQPGTVTRSSALSSTSSPAPSREAFSDRTRRQPRAPGCP